MHEQFSLGFMQPPGTKKFTITDDKLIYGSDEYNYKDLSQITLLVAPTPITNGVAQVVINGKVKTLGYKFSDRERAAAAINYANQQIDKAHGIKKDFKYRLQAHTGTSLEVYDSYLILNFMATGSVVSNIAKGGANGGKRINYADLTAIQFKEPAGVSVGFIQFAYPGSTELKGGVVAAVNDENSIPVSPQNLQQAREIVNYIESRRAKLRNPTVAVAAAPSSMDELRKLKNSWTWASSPSKNSTRRKSSFSACNSTTSKHPRIIARVFSYAVVNPFACWQSAPIAAGTAGSSPLQPHRSAQLPAAPYAHHFLLPP